MDHATEVQAGERFAFGKNWRRFLRTLDDDKVAAATKALSDMLGDIRGKSFLDVGCGSGLSALAAHRLGANVRAFDYDPQSVACTRELQRRCGGHWQVDEGSALDTAYLATLGTFDVVYSWGVLHHTGDMRTAFKNVAALVKPGGLLFIAIYNDQGWKSEAWHALKAIYNSSLIARAFLLLTVAPAFTAARIAARVSRGSVADVRGMSLWHDMIDWLGGYPFEVADLQSIVVAFDRLGFRSVKIVPVGNRSGCNEYVFRRV